MRLTIFSDYTLRTLMYLALHPDRFVTIAEVAAAYRVSSNHLMKVAQYLAAGGEVITLRGQHGGLRLARPAGSIGLGDVIRRTEPDMALVPCPVCVIQPGCRLPSVLDQALAAFMAVLDAHTVADLVADPDRLLPLLRQPAGEPVLASETVDVQTRANKSIGAQSIENRPSGKRRYRPSV